MERVTKDHVAVLSGESGCGKTSLMAKIAKKVKKWIGTDSSTVVVRFIGTTPDSSDARFLISSMCEQIVKANASKDSKEEKVPQVREMSYVTPIYPMALGSVRNFRCFLVLRKLLLVSLCVVVLVWFIFF